MWEYEFDGKTDETILYWDGQQQASIDGQIQQWHNGFPLGEAREAVAEAVQAAGTPERIRMQFDLNYGFEERDE